MSQTTSICRILRGATQVGADYTGPNADAQATADYNALIAAQPIPAPGDGTTVIELHRIVTVDSVIGQHKTGGNVT